VLAGSRRSLITAVDVSGMLRLTDWRARAIFALFTLTNAVNAIATLGEVRWPAVALVAVAVVTFAAGLLLIPAPDPYPARLTAAVVVLTVAVVCAAWNIVPDGVPGWSAWFWGASGTVLLFLALRGRIGAAWAGMALMTLVAVAWALSSGETAWFGIVFVIRHAAMLLVGTFFALYLRNTAGTIERIHLAGRERARSQEGARAAIEEQRARLERLRSFAEPALHLLASDAPIDDAQRDRLRLLEATLRDWLRADGLATEPVLEAARRARERGVDVTLLDDSAAALEDPALAERIEHAVLEALDAQESGEITVRVLPVDRDAAATIRGSGPDGGVRVDIPRVAPVPPAP
jgi:hypothetical protein